MSTRADLLAVAEGLAAAAKNAMRIGEHPSSRPGGPPAGAPPSWEHSGARAVEAVAAAKLALEAAALADGMPPDEIAAALDGMREQLAAAQLAPVAKLGPIPFLGYVLDLVSDYVAVLMSRDQFIAAHKRLHDLAEGLERDFTAADSETSRRLAARIHAALEEAAALIDNGRNDGHE